MINEPEEFNPEPLDLDSDAREMEEMKEGQGSIFGGLEPADDEEEPDDFSEEEPDPLGEADDEEADDFQEEEESWEDDLDDDWDDDDEGDALV